MERWDIGVSAWIIQDGNYHDFSKGQLAEFALEFYAPQVALAGAAVKQVQPLADAHYHVAAEVIYCSEDACVLDFGIRAYRNSRLPEEINVGDYVTADLYLDIDPFFYVESLHKVRDLPPLVYTWRIDSISMQTAPYVETRDEQGHRFLVRDTSKLGYRTIERTNASSDDDGSAEYILHCTLLPDEPKRRRERAL